VALYERKDAADRDADLAVLRNPVDRKARDLRRLNDARIRRALPRVGRAKPC
jgi:hypothetical protein